MSNSSACRMTPASRGHAVDAGLDLVALRADTYIEFLLGHGEAPGLHLGSPLAFDRDGTVFSQRFARGLTLANVGAVPVEVALERPYYDLTGVRRTSVTVAAHSAEVLLAALPSVPRRAMTVRHVPRSVSAD